MSSIVLLLKDVKNCPRFSKISLIKRLWMGGPRARYPKSYEPPLLHPRGECGQLRLLAYKM